MPKNIDSTAVNELIEAVSQKPVPSDPADDLMFKVPENAALQTTNLRGPHKLGKAISAVVGGEVVSLPRHRTPNGTQQESSIKVSPSAHGTPAPARPVVHPKALPAVERPGPHMGGPPPEDSPILASRGRASDRSSPGPSDSQRRAALPPPRRNSQPPIDQANVTLMGTGPRSVPPPVPPAAASPNPGLTLMGQGALSAKPTTIPPPVPPPPPAVPAVPEVLAAPEAAVDAPHPFSAAVQRSAVPERPLWLDKGEQHEETWVGTVQVQRRTNWKHVVGKLAGPMVILIVVGVFIGGYFAFDGEGGKKRTPKTAAAAPAKTDPAPAESGPLTVAKLEAAKAEAAATEPSTEAAKTDPVPSEPANTDVAKTDAPKTEVANAEPAKTEPGKVEPTKADAARADTTKADTTKADIAKAEPAKTEVARAEPPAPSAASTMLATPTPAALVDVRIDSKPAGATVMLVDRGKTTFLGTTPLATAVDPTRTYELVFSYTNKPSQIEKLDPSTTKHVSVALGKAHSSSRSRTAALPKLELDSPSPKKAAAQPAGEGVLMISSKPPCEIVIDGKATGLTTPQRSIPLPAGSHKIMLINKAENIKKTLAVQITADTSTKVIQDLMK